MNNLRSLNAKTIFKMPVPLLLRNIMDVVVDCQRAQRNFYSNRFSAIKHNFCFKVLKQGVSESDSMIMEENMKNVIIISFLAIAFTGCATTKVVAFDNGKNTVSIQANKSAGQDGAQKEADKYCGHKAKLVSMGTKNVGSVMNDWGVVQNIENNVYTFACR